MEYIVGVYALDIFKVKFMAHEANVRLVSAGNYAKFPRFFLYFFQVNI